MHKQVTHHNSCPKLVIVIVVMILIVSVGGLSAFAGSTLPCRAECCCGKIKAGPGYNDTLAMKTKSGACCHGSEADDGTFAGCPKAPEVQPTVLSLSLPSNEYKPLFWGASYCRPPAQPYGMLFSLTDVSRPPPAFYKIPIFIQKSTLLC